MSRHLSYFWSTGRGTSHHEFNDRTDLCVNAKDTITGARVGHLCLAVFQLLPTSL